MVEEYTVFAKKLPNGVTHTVKVYRREHGTVLVHYVEDTDGTTIYWFEAVVDALAIDTRDVFDIRVTGYVGTRRFYEVIVDGDYVGYNIYEDDS